MIIHQTRTIEIVSYSKTLVNNLVQGNCILSIDFLEKKRYSAFTMKIQYLGHSSFLLSDSRTTIITDPFSPEIGFPFPSVKADTVTVSHQHSDHNNSSGVEGNPIVFYIPGEYERKGVRIYGYTSFHDDAKGTERGKNTMFKFVMDGVVILHLGDIGHELSDNELEHVKDTNILMIPIGGVYTIDAHTAQKLSKAIGAEIVIPMHYKTDKHDPKVFGQLQTVEDFLKNTDIAKRREEKILSVTAESISQEREVVILS